MLPEQMREMVEQRGKHKLLPWKKKTRKMEKKKRRRWTQVTVKNSKRLQALCAVEARCVTS